MRRIILQEDSPIELTSVAEAAATMAVMAMPTAVVATLPLAVVVVTVASAAMIVVVVVVTVVVAVTDFVLHRSGGVEVAFPVVRPVVEVTRRLFQVLVYLAGRRVRVDALHQRGDGRHLRCCHARPAFHPYAGTRSPSTSVNTVFKTRS
jgi:hypothetical protein